VFNLVGLVLGFALIEVLAGLARTLRARRVIRIGWLTPLLGVWVLFDVTTFWGSAWELRDLLPSVWQSLGAGVVITSVYYLAASQVFPEHLTEHEELDSHYWSVKRFVLGLVLACNCATWSVDLLLGRIWGPVVTAINLLYGATLIALVFMPGKRANIALLLGLLGILIYGFIIP
jgi:hypothetical protein